MLLGSLRRTLSWISSSAILAVAFAVVPARVAAQAASRQTATPQSSAQPPQANGSIRAQTNLVLVRVIVRDANGNPVKGLAQKDFELTDDK